MLCMHVSLTGCQPTVAIVLSKARLSLSKLVLAIALCLQTHHWLKINTLPSNEEG